MRGEKVDEGSVGTMSFLEHVYGDNFTVSRRLNRIMTSQIFYEDAKPESEKHGQIFFKKASILTISVLILSEIAHRFLMKSTTNKKMKSVRF